MKKVIALFALCILISSLTFVIAQDESATPQATTSEEGNSIEIQEQTQNSGDEQQIQTETQTEFNKDPGLTPDSGLYFIDNFVEQIIVRNNPEKALDAREEKIAEAIVMVERGKAQEAQQVLEKAVEYGEVIEREASPEMKQKIEESSQQVQNVLEALKEQAETQNMDIGGEFDVNLEKEKSLIAAAEISSKIKELCVQLAELDPLEYSSICNFDEEKTKWKKNLHKELTEEQMNEAKKFGQIMKQCFQTSGRECKCEDISFYDFSIACSKIAPLAAECDSGSEEACKEMDGVEMPDLPEHLQNVFDEIESEFGEAKYGMYMPPECVKEGITDPKKCSVLMIKKNAPTECRQALLDANVKTEREGREICDRIMFEKYTPQECTDKGITDPKECGRFMEKNGKPKQNMGFGMDCKNIQDSTKRLECYDNMEKGMGENYGSPGVQLTWQCKENRIHDPADCEKFMREEWPQQEQMRKQEYQQQWQKEEQWESQWEVRQGGNLCPDGVCDEWEKNNYGCPADCGGQDYKNYQPGRDYQESECKDGCNQECPGASRTNCINEKCVCYYDESSQEHEDYSAPAPVESGGEPVSPVEPTQEVPSSPEPSSEPAPEPEESSESSETSETGITGEVISNQFLEYYSRK